MKIAHELVQLDYGGVEKVVRNIIKFDKANKHSVVAYKDGLFRKELEALGVEIYMPKDNEEIDIEADAIHIHTGGAVSPMANNLGSQFPIIETIHSPVRSPMPNRLIKQRIGVSKAVSRMNSNCTTIYNGIDIDELIPTKTQEEIKKELGIPEGIPVIGRLGRIGHDKCLEEWLLACYQLQREGVNFVPLVIGNEARDCKGYRGKLKLMVASLPVNGVIWTGHKTDIANYLQVMDVFLYPSPTEGFGLVFVEAMIMGAVIVTYRNDVTTEVVGGYSVLTENNIPALVDGAKKALDIKMIDELAPMAHNFAKEEFSAERMAMNYSEIYAKMQ